MRRANVCLKVCDLFDDDDDLPLGKNRKEKKSRRINGIKVERSGTGTTSNRLCDKGRFIYSFIKSAQLGPTQLQTIKKEQDKECERDKVSSKKLKQMVVNM